MSIPSSHQHQKEEFLLIYALTPTATPTSLSSLPLQSVKIGRGQLRHTWPQMAASSAASFTTSTTPSSTLATATATVSASTPTLSGSSSNSHSSSNITDALPTLRPRKIQFAGDVLEDWLFADSILNGELTTNTTTLTRSSIAAELDSLLNSAPQTPTGAKRHIRPAGRDSDVPPAANRATRSGPGSAKGAHITFLPLPASHNSAGAAKLHARCASPAPTARSRLFGSAQPRPTSVPSTASDPDLEQADLLLIRHEGETSRGPRAAASKSFASRLQHFRQQMERRRSQKLAARVSSSAPSVRARDRGQERGGVEDG